MKASFPVGDGYEFEVYWSHFGLEIYSVNGVEIRRLRSLSHRATRTFVVGEGDRQHHVEIKVDAVPTLRSWFALGEWVAQAYVDGELVVEDLTPLLRQRYKKIDAILKRILIIWLVLLAVVFSLILLVLSIELFLS